MKNIGENAFYSLSSLTSVTIPRSVTSIGWNAFENCKNLKEVHVDSLESWLSMDKSGWRDTPLRYGAVLYCNDEPIRDLVIPAGVTSIGNRAFDCCSLKSVRDHPKSCVNLQSSVE